MPHYPYRSVPLALGFVLGGMLAAAIVVFRFLMDDKIRTVDDIRQYAGLVTLAVVPIEDSVSNENTEKKKLGLRRKS